MTHNSHLAAETPQRGLTRTLKIGFFKLSGRETHHALGPRQHQSRGSPWGVRWASQRLRRPQREKSGDGERAGQTGRVSRSGRDLPSR